MDAVFLGEDGFSFSIMTRNTPWKKRFWGKRILLLGLGLHGGGLAAAKFLLRAGARLTVVDRKSRAELQTSIHALETFRRAGKFPRIRYRFEEAYPREFIRADGILKNPGVRPDAPILRMARKRRIPIYSDITLFFEWSPAPVIGVTGTRGKSTTAFLIAALLRRAKPRRRVWLGGNIRTSVLTFLPQLEAHDRVVLELSSFQLMDLPAVSKSPHIAVITNILNDHLNWHRSAREYARAKGLIMRFQTANDHVYIPAGDAALLRLVRRARARVHRVLLPPRFRAVVAKRIGAHYASSVGLAVAVARRFGVSRSAIWETLRRFRGLPYREEEIRVFRGIRFVNDTTATIPDASIAALRRFFHEAARRRRGVVLIAGGSDKKLDFREFSREVARRAKAVVFLPGDATEKMKDAFGRVGKIPTKDARSMSDAVRCAIAFARAGDIVLLSPGAASFGMFQNEFDRGDQFTREVKRLR